MIKDALGVVAKVGDKIVYSAGGTGANKFRHTTIKKITPKCVCWHEEDGWGGMTEYRRGEGCFVIKQENKNAD